jgi:hypothetical protein
MQYLGLFLLLALVTALGFILFSPMLKGWRTQIFGYLTIGAGGFLPLAGELVDYLQTLDWRQYVLASDRKNLCGAGHRQRAWPHGSNPAPYDHGPRRHEGLRQARHRNGAHPIVVATSWRRSLTP